jgi:heme/copper-type cytochrome/quinol oxidase subunit 1
LYNFFNSIFRGEKATKNPWESNTLEWTTPVEHIHGNWPGAIPTVYRGPHEYSRPDRESDYFPQNDPGNGEPEHYHAPAVVDTSYDGPKEKPSKVFFSSFAHLFFAKKVQA